MGDKIRVMYSEEEVDKRIRELGEQISKRYEGKTSGSGLRSKSADCCLRSCNSPPSVIIYRILQFYLLWILCPYQAMVLVQSQAVS